MAQLILYTVAEAAKLLKLSERSVRNHMRGYVSRNGQREPIDRLPFRMVTVKGYRIEASVIDIFSNRSADSLAYERLLRQYQVSPSLRKAS